MPPWARSARSAAVSDSPREQPRQHQIGGGGHAEHPPALWETLAAGHEVQPALPRRLESEPGAGRRSRQALGGLVLVQVTRVEQREAHRLGELTGARRRNQPPGRPPDRAAVPFLSAPLASRTGARSTAPFEFVGGESGEVGRSEPPGSHPRVSRR